MHEQQAVSEQRDARTPQPEAQQRHKKCLKLKRSGPDTEPHRLACIVRLTANDKGRQ